MATMRAQVAIPMFTNMPGDVITNTLHFTEVVPIGLDAVADAITPILQTFYNTCYATGRNMADYLVPAQTTVTWYDMSDVPPRAPDIRPMPITTTVQGTTVPTEVSFVLSFQGLQVSGQPQARRRGRIYLGGMTNSWMATSSFTAFPTFDSTDVAAVGDAANVMKLAATAAGARWSVWSQMNQAAVFVENGWVDNSPDTQRRRSVDPTARNVWP